MLEAHFDPQVSRSADVTGATQYDSGQRLRIYRAHAACKNDIFQVLAVLGQQRHAGKI